MQINKYKTLVAACCLLAMQSQAQLYVESGATLYIESGATVTVQGDLTSNANIQGPGKIQLKGPALQNVNMNGFSVSNMELDNSANAVLTGAAQVTTNFLFTNGRILFGANNLTLGSAATISGASNISYFVTNGAGRLKKSALGNTAFLFPVGNSATSYNPVSITNAGTVDDIAVGSLANVYTNGLTGTAITKEVADASWDISEAVAGGSNLTLTTSWYTADELPGFNRAKSGISNYIPTPGPTQGWDLLNSQVTAASGTGVHPTPYTFTRTGITSTGAFAVGFRPVLSPLLVTPKIFLQASYNGTALMDDKLRTVTVAASGTTDATHGVIPTTEPYSAIGGANFTSSGSGGGETITPGVFGIAASSTANDIVDWVFLQLHDGTTGTVVSSRAALLKRNGDIVETDGVSPVNFAGNAAASYYVSIKHRNHLGIRTAGNLSLAKTTNTAYNFSDNLTKAYNNPAITNNPAMITLAAGVYGLYTGNANSDISVRVTGNASLSDYQRILTTLGSALTVGPTYSASDVNMDGTVRVTGTASLSDYLKILTALGSGLIIVNQHQ
ncbi:MAG: hypothetical protein JWQ27_887 [Ferruginibacter sp.]|nr:hypothetical protein [Ferruginibacter sp.]